MKRFFNLISIFAFLFSCDSGLDNQENKYEVTIEQSCGFDKDVINKKVYAFASDIEADNALEKIMKLTGLPPNFEIKSADVPNACAVVKCDDEGGCKRIIYYNQEFIEKMNSATNSDFTELAILAHEIGHHLSGHTIAETKNRHEEELEADKFAGFILHQLGASLKTTKKVFSFSPEEGSASHPPRDARIAAISSGWYNSKRKGNSTKIWTLIPDINFEKKLIDLGYDDKIDGKILRSNISDIDSLDVMNSNIYDMTGIEDFTDLKYLSCAANYSPFYIDLSQNTDLTYLSCFFNGLKTLDLSQNTALEHLQLGFNELTSLDVSACRSLKKLQIPHNHLTTIDLSQNTALEDFRCSNNELTSLDVSQNTALKVLSVDNLDGGSTEYGENHLTTIDLSQNTALKFLSVDNNQLTSLDVSNNKALESLNCYNNQLTSLDVSNNKALTKLRCHNNQLTSLDLSNNKSLESLDCYGNKFDCESLKSDLFFDIDEWLNSLESEEIP